MSTENNKIIAEFMGVSKSKIEAKGKILNFENSKYNTYHKDYNWLMEVVEKIEALQFTIDIDGVSCYIYSNDDNGINVTRINKTKKEAVYNACVEFIKWYNKQNN